MSTQTDPTRIRFVQDALVLLATQIRNYCVSVPESFVWLKAPEQRKHVSLYVRNAVRLTDQLARLIQLSATAESMAGLNHEALEALLEEARGALNAVRRRILVLN